MYDTALLRRAAFPAIRDGGQIVVVRGWDGDEVEDRGIRVQPVFVATRARAHRLARGAARARLRADGSSSAWRGEFPPEQAAEAERVMDAGGLRGRAVIVF